MPAYLYQAIDKRGRSRNGSLSAQDEVDLQKKLKDLGLWLTESSLDRSSEGKAKSGKSPLHQLPFKGKVPRREIIDFCTLLTFQVQAGVPLVQALAATAEDCKHPPFRNVIHSIQAHIESGLEFHEALAHFPNVFSQHFISVTRAGVMSGKLPETLKHLKNYLEWVDQILAEVRQAALYPAILVVVVVGFTGFLFTVIIPKFAELLDKMHVAKPLLTQVVLGASQFARASWWLWVPVFFGVVFGLPLGRHFSPRFALWVDRVKLRIPVFGSINLMLALSRFSHNLAILYRSGIPIVESLKQCQNGLIGNRHVEEAIGRVITDVKSGSTISEAMQRQPVFSSMLVRMVSLGETTGNLDTALVTVSEYYNDIIPRRIKSLFGIIEPALMLFIIGIVGTVALSIYLPILSLMGTIH